MAACTIDGLSNVFVLHNANDLEGDVVDF